MSDFRLLSCYFDHFATLVMAAEWACPVRKLLLVALRAFGHADFPERIMCAALARAGSRMSPFWIWHQFTSKK
jgi:hypothetical protein